MKNQNADPIDDANQDELVNNDENNDEGVSPDPPPQRVEFSGMTAREEALVTKARAEEKRKLQRRLAEQETALESLRKEMRELRNTPPSVVPKGGNREDRIDALVGAVERLTTLHQETNARLDQMSNDEIARRRESELRAYAVRRIAEVREDGGDVIEALVGGDSEEEIDNSILIARAEYQLVVQKEEARRGSRRGNNGPSSVTVQNGGRRPAGVPQVQVPNSVEADITENIADLTSDEAVRNGDFEKNRKQLLGKLKRSFRYTGDPANGRSVGR